MKRLKLSSLVSCALLATAISKPAQADEALETNRAKWEAAGIAAYEYRYQKVCVCHKEKPSDTIIAVSNGEIVGVRYDHEDYLDEVPVPPEKYDWFRTIDDLFALITGALEREAVVRVSYEPELGYPLRIYVDYEQDLVGEEIELQILEVREAS